MATSVKPKEPKRPWIMWEGGECPVPEGTLIDVKHRDGHKQKGCPAGYTHAEFMRHAIDWTHDDAPADIIAYRPAKPKKAKPEWEILWGSAEDFEGAPDWAVYAVGVAAFAEDVVHGSRLQHHDGGQDTVRGLANLCPRAARRLKQPK